MGYQIESNGLVTGPEEERCAGYLINFSGHGAFDPTGKITVGNLSLTQAQCDAHNKLLAEAELKGMIEHGRGIFFLSQTEKRNSVTNWLGTFRSAFCHVKTGYSYGFCAVKTCWIWFTGPDGKQWYGVQKGDGQSFTARRLKHG